MLEYLTSKLGTYPRYKQKLTSSSTTWSNLGDYFLEDGNVMYHHLTGHFLCIRYAPEDVLWLLGSDGIVTEIAHLADYAPVTNTFSVLGQDLTDWER